jgi:hypothetical protein
MPVDEREMPRLGGSIVAVGTPEDIARVAASHTGRHLIDVLGQGREAAAMGDRS